MSAIPVGAEPLATDATTADAIAVDVAGGPSTALGNHSRLNLASTAIGFVISIGTGLWFTPFLIRTLGPAAYGLIPLATSVVSYFSLLTQALSSVLNRSIANALTSGDDAQANRAFGTALGGSLILSAILAVPLAALSWLSPLMFHIPAGAVTGTRILFAVVAVTFLLSLVTTPFQSITFSRNRLFLGNINAAAQTITRIGVTVGLFAFAATIDSAGIGILTGALTGLVLAVVFARITAPNVRSLSLAIDRVELRAISKTSSHQLIMQVGTVMIMSCELVIVNQLFGAEQGGRYASTLQWLMLLRNATMTLVVLAVPTMLSLAAEKKTQPLIDYTNRAMLWVAICGALPAGYLCSFAPDILSVWLGPKFTGLWPVMVVQLLPLVITATALPLYSITLAADRMLVAGLVQCATAVLAIVLGIALGWWGGPIMVAVGVGWTLALKELVFVPWYAARNIGRPAGTFFAPLGQSVLLLALAIGLSRGAAWVIHPTSLIALGLTGVLISVLYAGIVAAVMPAMARSAIDGLRGRRGAA